MMEMNRSLCCPLEGKPEHILRALDETERFAREEGLPNKSALHLRLLAEELLGMVGSMLCIDEGTFQIERSEDAYILRLNAVAKVGDTARSLLVDVASDRKNAAYAGVKGKIFQFLDYLYAGNTSAAITLGASGQGVAEGARSYNWSYRAYCARMEKDKAALDWDAMEKSILNKLTKDIVVAVRSNGLEITMITARDYI